MGGDKGYYKVDPRKILGAAVLLTDTAVAAAAADGTQYTTAALSLSCFFVTFVRLQYVTIAKRTCIAVYVASKQRGNSKTAQQSKFLKDNPHALLNPRFAHHRCAIERVIGRIKQISAFIAGPIYEIQDRRLADALLVVAAIVNRQLSMNPNLFVKEQ